MSSRAAPVKLPKGIADPLAFERIKAVPTHRRRSAPDTRGLQYLDPGRPVSRGSTAGCNQKPGQRSRRASNVDRFKSEPGRPRSRSTSRGIDADRFKSDPGRPPSRPDSQAAIADGFKSGPGRPQGTSPRRGSTAGGRRFSPGSNADLRNPDVRGIMARRKSTSITDLRSTCVKDLRNLAVQPLLVEKFPNNNRPSSHLSALPPRGVSIFEQESRRNSTKSSVGDAPGQPSWEQIAESVLNGDSPRDSNDKVAPDASDESTNGPPSSQDSSLSDQSQIAGYMEGRRSSKSNPDLGSRAMEDVRDRHIKLSRMEVSTAEHAFVRFLAPDVSEMERDRLQEVLIYLGYLAVTEEVVNEVAEEISGFSTFAFDEFLELLDLYAKHEHKLLLKTFESHSNERGKMNTQQLSEAMQVLSMTPLKATIREILPIAGGAEQGLDGFMVDLDAFLNFMAMYRVRQGFTNAEVLNAHHVYDEAVSHCGLGGGSPFASTRSGGASRVEIRVHELAQTLIELYGPFMTEHIQKQIETVVSEWTAECCQMSPGKQKSQLVPFHEFLIWARRVREAALGEMWTHFERGIADDSGLLPIDCLGDVMRGLGFTLFSEELDELAEEADLRTDERIDFDHFVAFVDTCRRCGGFRHKELEEFNVLLKRFDYDQSKEIEKLEFVDLLRHLGYSTSLEDVLRFMEQADFNNTASIDFTEFVWLMRLHRELELANVKRVFEEHCDDSCKGLLRRECGKAMSDLDQAPREMQGLQDKKLEAFLGDCPEVLNFNDFVSLVDKCRVLVVKERRLRAGFNEEEFDRLQKRFEAHLKPGSSHLERGAFLWLIMEMGVNIKSLEERDDIFSMVDDARRSAIGAGVEPKEVGELGSQSMSLAAIVHFLSLWRRKYDSQKVIKEEEVIDEARFSRSEVAGFRELFVEWVESTTESSSSEKPAAKSPSATPSGSRACSKQATMPALPEDTGAEEDGLVRRSSMPQISTLATRRGSLPIISAINTRRSSNAMTKSHTEKSCQPVCSMVSRSNSIDINTNQALLPVKTLKQLLSSIGVELSALQCREMTIVIQKFEGRNKANKITFVTFLRVMRWMLDTNFADVNGQTQKIVARIKPARSGASRASPTAVTDSIDISITPPAPAVTKRRYSIA